MSEFEIHLHSLRMPKGWVRQLAAIGDLLTAHAETKHGTKREARRLRGEAIRQLGRNGTYAIFRADRGVLTSRERKELMELLIEARFPACIIQRITGHARKTVARHAGKLHILLLNWRWGRVEPERVRFSDRRLGAK